MSFTLTIGGVTKTIRSNSLHVSKTFNGRATLACLVTSLDGSYRPALGDEVVLSESGTPIIGGLIERPSEGGFGGESSTDAIDVSISVGDYNSYPERRVVNETLAAGTLKSQLETLVTNYLAIFGVTLDAGQVDGPSMPEVESSYKQCDEVLNTLATLTAAAGIPYGWRIDASKVLSMSQPGASAAPFDITTVPAADVVGDIVVEESSDDGANRIFVVLSPKTEIGRIETFVGDGVTSTFTLQYTLTKSYGIINVYESDGVTPAGGETFGIPPDAPLQWSYDSTTNEITRLIGPTDATKIYKLMFDGVFQGVWTAEDASATTDPDERAILVDDIPSDTTGQALADAELAKRLSPTKTVRYSTYTSGFEPGQAQTITLARRNLSGTALITDVVTRDVGSRLKHEITAIIDDAQTNLDRGWRDVYKAWAGDNAGGSGGSVAVGGASSSGAAPPLNSVQINRDGALGGDADFTYDEAQNVVVCGGGGSSVDASGVESSQVFGYNCRIGA